MKTLYLHIGTPKTGSSAIQEFCADNREALKRNGCCYPAFPYRYPKINANKNGAFLVADVYKNDVRDAAEEKRRRRECIETIARLLQQYDKVVISNEDIWRRGQHERRACIWDELKAAGWANGFDIKVIVYLRRQDLLIESWWNQRVKGARFEDGLSWEDYLRQLKDDPRFDYYKVLEGIASTIGRENIIVRRFDRALFPGGQIQYDFLNCIGLPMSDEYKIRPEDRNTRLSGNTPQIQYVLNNLPGMDADTHRHFRNILMQYSDISEAQYPVGMFSAEEAKAFVGRYEEGNRKIAREYLHEENGELFDMSFKNCRKWERNNPYMHDDIIRFAGLSDMYLLEMIQDLQRENDALYKEIQRLDKRMLKLGDKLKRPVHTLIRNVLRHHK